MTVCWQYLFREPCRSPPTRPLLFSLLYNNCTHLPPFSFVYPFPSISAFFKNFRTKVLISSLRSSFHLRALLLTTIIKALKSAFPTLSLLPFNGPSSFIRLPLFIFLRPSAFIHMASSICRHPSAVIRLPSSVCNLVFFLIICLPSPLDHAHFESKLVD